MQLICLKGSEQYSPSSRPQLTGLFQGNNHFCLSSHFTIRDAEFTVCGDTHGQYYDLLNIFKINGNPSESNPYLFNGDFVDRYFLNNFNVFTSRGSFSLEVILTLFAWKICNPNILHLTRGNHESRTMNKLYG